MLIERAKKEFANGTVYALYTKDGYPNENNISDKNNMGKGLIERSNLL